MNKKVLIPIIIVGLLLVAGIAYLAVSLNKQKEENRAMQELAEMDKKEMENEYQQFARQYSEMKTQINNDSIVAQLTAEQERTQQLLEELRRTKSNDAREISRLKKELATVRAVLRSYVLEIDSLNRLNQDLKDENNRMRGQYEEATRQIEGLNTEKASVALRESCHSSTARCHRHQPHSKGQEVEDHREAEESQGSASKLLHSQKRYRTKWHEDSLRAHHIAYGSCSRWRRNIQLREP